MQVFCRKRSEKPSDRERPSCTGTFIRLGTVVQVLRGMLCLNVLSLGYFSLHEQREVTRSPDASGNPQDARQEKNEIKITAVPPSPAPSARPLPPAGEAGWLQAEREVRPRTEWRAGALLGRGARLHAAIDEIRLG